MVLICISLMISVIEHLLLCLLASVRVLWKNVYSCPLPVFKIRLFVLVILSCVSSLYILDISPLSDYIICKYLLLFSRVPHFVDNFIHCAKAFLV